MAPNSLSTLEATPPFTLPEHNVGPGAQPTLVAPSVSSNDILRGQKAVDIQHNGSTYKLQATRLGKLILTK